jgi:hypothetical protein
MQVFCNNNLKRNVFCDKLKKRVISGGKNMKTFINFFDDSEVFTHKFPDKGDQDTTHINTLVNSITGKFSEIIIGD